jgi:hypothetical protein
MEQREEGGGREDEGERWEGVWRVGCGEVDLYSTAPIPRHGSSSGVGGGRIVV